jgi:gamma-glutamyltranspeptidase/glutathione hydrolase
MTLLKRWIIATALGVAFAGLAYAQEAADAVAPEAATPALRLQAADSRRPVRAKNWMVAAANPLAAEAGADILRRGGSAADAAIAVQLVLGLVEPQSSGLGGGAFALYWNAAAQTLTTYDGRETAPRAATPTLFQDENGEPLKFFDAVIGGRSVGVPGTPMLLSEMHKHAGLLAWADLFEAPIRLAGDGFPVSPRLAALIAATTDSLSRFEATRSYFMTGVTQALATGEPLKNPDYAQTLRTLRDGGASAFYSGPIAEDIVATVRNASGNPGTMTLEDLAAYRVKIRPPVCVAYRGHDVCGMGPPSSGGLTVGQILGMLAPFDMAGQSPDDPQTWRLIGDASRLAFADRGRYMADNDFVPMPTAGLIDPLYLEERALKLDQGTGKAMVGEEVRPGDPKWDHAFNLADGEALDLPSTSHFVIVDVSGNIVSMTTTIENGFGSRLMVRGFLLNNELTDFSFRSHKGGVPVANRVEPGKRPRSSMAPTIVLAGGAPVLAVGSPGGSRIIPYVAKTLIAILDWGMDVQAAVDMPHLVNRFGTYDLEAGTAAEAFAGQLEALGYKTNVRALNSGLHAIAITPDGLAGGADPRREGVALGE